MELKAAALLYRQAIAHLQAAPVPARIGIINALAHPALREIASLAADIRLQQTNRSTWRALSAQGFTAVTAMDGAFDCMLLLASRHRAQTLGWMAAAMQRLVAGGTLICCCPNAMGARSYEQRLRALAGNLYSISASKCRVFSCRRTAAWDAALADSWAAEAAPSRQPDTGLYTQPGLFSWRRPDAGSRLLLSHLPTDLAGTGMDLCCGYGLIAAGLLSGARHIEALHLVDAEQLALACARMNLARHRRGRLSYHWLDAASEPLPGGLDWIALNPPFHSGRKRDVALGRRIVAAACQALAPGARLFIVANRKLPYEHALRARLRHIETRHEGEGYKVLFGTK